MDLSPYASAAEVHSVEGRVGCGKTQRLVEAVLDLLAQGVPPREIILFAATPAAACALERRLKAVVPLEDLPLVTTLPLYALDVLSSPQAEARGSAGPHPHGLRGAPSSGRCENLRGCTAAPQRNAEVLLPQLGRPGAHERRLVLRRAGRARLSPARRLLAPSRVLPRLRASPRGLRLRPALRP